MDGWMTWFMKSLKGVQTIVKEKPIPDFGLVK